MWLKEYPDMTSAQVYDWLQERLNVTSVAENTVRSYVKELRETYHIPIIKVTMLFRFILISHACIIRSLIY